MQMSGLCFLITFVLFFVNKVRLNRPLVEKLSCSYPDLQQGLCLRDSPGSPGRGSAWGPCHPAGPSEGLLQTLCGRQLAGAWPRPTPSRRRRRGSVETRSTASLETGDLKGTFYPFKMDVFRKRWFSAVSGSGDKHIDDYFFSKKF